MFKVLRWVGFGLAVAFLVLTVVNASWIAPVPTGSVKLIARSGLAPEFLPRSDDECDARIAEPHHRYLDNTLAGTLRAYKLGAALVELDIRRSADDRLVLYGADSLDCRTSASGPVEDATLAQLQALDTGYALRTEAGEFPLRGKGAGPIPSLADLIARFGYHERALYRLPAGDSEAAKLLVAQLRAADRDPVKERDAFHGDDAPLAPIRAAFPEAWIWSGDAARACTADYRLTGWSGVLPESCKGGTMLVPTDAQFTLWGWPNRLIARMEEHGGQIVVTAPDGGGLTLPEQFSDVPNSFNGYILVDDLFTLGPALHNRLDDRTQAEIDAAQAALERRRARR